MKLSYRKAVSGDADLLVAIYNSSFYDDYVRYGEYLTYALAGEWFTAHGTGSNLGWFCKKENEPIANKMRTIFAKWIDNGHNNVVGHLILRYTDTEKKVIRFGFVIVDDAKRGKGYGRKMLALAMKYAFDIFGAGKITLGVFDNNKPAYCCYKAAGVRETGEESFCELNGERWRIVEMEIERNE